MNLELIPEEKRLVGGSAEFFYSLFGVRISYPNGLISFPLRRGVVRCS